MLDAGLMITLENDYQTALEGRRLWLKIKKKFEFQPEDALIFCSINSSEYLLEVKQWLPGFAERKQFGNTIFVYVGNKGFLQDYHSDHKIYECCLEKVQMECLLKYYRLTQFVRYGYVISFEWPFGNDCMLGHKGVTFADWLRNFG